MSIWKVILVNNTIETADEVKETKANLLLFDALGYTTGRYLGDCLKPLRYTSLLNSNIFVMFNVVIIYISQWLYHSHKWSVSFIKGDDLSLILLLVKEQVGICKNLPKALRSVFVSYDFQRSFYRRTYATAIRLKKTTLVSRFVWESNVFLFIISWFICQFSKLLSIKKHSLRSMAVITITIKKENQNKK